MNNSRRCGVVAFTLTLVSVAAIAETWSPSPEPSFLLETRRTLQASGKLSERPWIFMEALDSPTLKAGEYLSNPDRTPISVEFDAALLLRPQGQTVWKVRELRMRALCNQERLQRSVKGQWLDYVGREDTGDKVRWICALPAAD